MIPAYLTDLDLPTIFAPYCANVDTYMQQSNKDEHIVDSETMKVSGFVTASFGQDGEKAGKYFEVKNPKGKIFSLLQIDNGIIQTTSTKKCDCIIADTDTLCLIEFKANATSSSANTIKKNYKKAMKQLIVTKDIMQNGLTDLGKNLMTLRNIEAFVCFRKGYPRITTSEMNYKVSFATRTGGIPLSFDSMKEL